MEQSKFKLVGTMSVLTPQLPPRPAALPASIGFPTVTIICWRQVQVERRASAVGGRLLTMSRSPVQHRGSMLDSRSTMYATQSLNEVCVMPQSVCVPAYTVVNTTVARIAAICMRRDIARFCYKRS